MAFFLISSVVLGLLDQLQIFLQFHLKELLGLLELYYLIDDDCSTRIWQAGLLLKLKSCGISGHIFGLVSSLLSNRQLQVVLDGKYSQEYPVKAGVSQGSILDPTLFLL